MTKPDNGKHDMTNRRGAMLPDPIKTPTLTVPEAGQILGLSRDGAYSAAARGEIPTIRFGRRLVVPTARLMAMLGIGEEASA